MYTTNKVNEHKSLERETYNTTAQHSKLICYLNDRENSSLAILKCGLNLL